MSMVYGRVERYGESRVECRCRGCSHRITVLRMMYFVFVLDRSWIDLTETDLHFFFFFLSSPFYACLFDNLCQTI